VGDSCSPLLVPILLHLVAATFIIRGIARAVKPLQPRPVVRLVALYSLPTMRTYRRHFVMSCGKNKAAEVRQPRPVCVPFDAATIKGRVEQCGA